MKDTLTDEGGRLVSVLQVRAAKKYRVEVTADLADGSRKRWYSDGIKYPKSVKTKKCSGLGSRCELCCCLAPNWGWSMCGAPQ